MRRHESLCGVVVYVIISGKLYIIIITDYELSI